MKLSELVEIKSVPVQLISRDTAYTYYTEKRPRVLHICEKEGCKHNRCGITRCNRVLLYPIVAFSLEDKHDTVKLCSRCGTRADFEQAMTEYNERQKTSRAARDAKREAKLSEQQRIRDEKIRRLEQFIHRRVIGAPFILNLTGPTYTMRVDDAVFEIACEEIL